MYKLDFYCDWVEIVIEISDVKLKKIAKSVSEQLLGIKYNNEDFEKIKSEIVKCAKENVDSNIYDIVQSAVESFHG